MPWRVRTVWDMGLDKVRATLDFITDLAASKVGLTLDEVCVKRGVSRRTAERMRDLVEDLFGPLERRRDGKSVRFRLSLPKGLQSLTAPTNAELAELINLARAMKARDPARATALDSLSQKILAALPQADRRRLEPDIEAQLATEVWAHVAGPLVLGKPDVVQRVRHAILAGRMVEVAYRRVGDEAVRSYTLTPYGFVLGPPHYLVAGFPDADVPRLMRLDRIDEATEREELGHRPEDFDLGAFAERSFGFFQEDPEAIELVFDPAAAAEARSTAFHRTQEMRELEDGRLQVTFEAGGLMELARFLAPWRDHVEAVRPERLRSLLSQTERAT